VNFNSNWQTVSAGRIGRGGIGSELVDNFSLVYVFVSLHNASSCPVNGA